MKPATSTHTSVAATCDDCRWTFDDARNRPLGRPRGTPISRAREAIAEHIEKFHHRARLHLLTVHRFEP